jgi:hypothetical protein
MSVERCACAQCTVILTFLKGGLLAEKFSLFCDRERRVLSGAQTVLRTSREPQKTNWKKNNSTHNVLYYA